MSFLGILAVYLSSKILLLTQVASFSWLQVVGRGFSLGLAEVLALLSELGVQ